MMLSLPISFFFPLVPPPPHTPHFHSFEKQTQTKLTHKFCQREKQKKELALYIFKKNQNRRKGGNFSFPSHYKNKK
jgi:hypothetical protein